MMTFCVVLLLFVACAVCDCEFERCNANVEAIWFDARNEAAKCARVALFDCALWPAMVPTRAVRSGNATLLPSRRSAQWL
jgi:hypothetical protein